MFQPLPPSPPPPAVSLSAMFRLRPGPVRFYFAARAGLAMGLCAAAGWLLGAEALGLLATLGAFAALYGSGRPYRHRAALLAVIGAGFVVCVAGGVWAAGAASLWPGVLLTAGNPRAGSILSYLLHFLSLALYFPQIQFPHYHY